MTKPYFPPPKEPVATDPYRSPGVRPAEPTEQLPTSRLSVSSHLHVCPACKATMSPRRHGTFSTYDCPECRGIFLDTESIHHIVSGGAEAAAQELLSAYPLTETLEHRGAQMYVKCPVCSKMMNRTQFARGAKTIVDVCKDHGTFFDQGELPRVIDFVLHGGLERAAEKDREAARERRQNELANARYLASRSPVSTFDQRDQETLYAAETFADLLANLLLR